MVQWLRLCASNAEGTDSIPGWGTKIPHAVWYSKKKKKKKKCLEINILWQFQDLLKEKYKILVREIKEVLKSWVLGSISSYEDTTQ